MSFDCSPLLRLATVLLTAKNSKMSADLFSLRSFSPLRETAILRMVLRYSIRVGRTLMLLGKRCFRHLPGRGRRCPAPVFFDHLRLDPLYLGVRERGDDVPADVESLLDAPVFVDALLHEHLLESLRDLEELPVGLAQALLADDRGEGSVVLALGVAGVELVCEASVVLPGPPLADALVHEPGEALEHVDGRVDAAPVEVPADVDLALGDVAREVGDGVGLVVRWHREYRYLGDGALPALYLAGPLVQGGEVGVGVPGEAPPTGDLVPCRGDLSQRLAVVGHVGEDDEDVGLPLVCEELRGGEREPGREDPLHRGVGGEVEEEDGPLEGASFLELADEVVGLLAGYSHRGEDHGEALRGAEHLCLPRDLRGEGVVREPAPGEDGEFLPPD